MVLIILLACRTVGRYGGICRNCFGQEAPKLLRKRSEKLNYSHDQQRLQEVIFIPAEVNELSSPQLHEHVFSAVREPWAPTYVTWTILLFFCVYVHGGTRSYSCGVNVRAIIHFRGHKCHKPAVWQRKGTFFFFFFILQILMSYYLFVAVCHIINLLVRQCLCSSSQNELWIFYNASN